MGVMRIACAPRAPPASRRRVMPDKAIELWTGVECTVNRVGDTYYDQLRATGHHGAAKRPRQRAGVRLDLDLVTLADVPDTE